MAFGPAGSEWEKMNRHLMRASSIAFVLLVCGIAAAPHEPSQRRDGNWWREMGSGGKFVYVTGFFDGMDLGNNFSYWGIVDKQKNDPAMTKVANSYDSYMQRYLTNVTNGQLADGLDKFYSDFRNRRIKVNSAVWLVLNEIAGEPE